MKTFLIEGSRNGETWLTVTFELDEVEAVKSLERCIKEYPDLKIRFRQSSTEADA